MQNQIQGLISGIDKWYSAEVAGEPSLCSLMKTFPLHATSLMRPESVDQATEASFLEETSVNDGRFHGRPRPFRGDITHAQKNFTYGDLSQPR